MSSELVDNVLGPACVQRFLRWRVADVHSMSSTTIDTVVY